MKPYITGELKALLLDTEADRLKRGYSKFAALAAAEMVVIDRIRAWDRDGEFGPFEEAESAEAA